MLRKLVLALALAGRDWRHEWALSLCAVVALVSMLAPLLVLWGVRNGVTNGMREKLLEDPTVLVITPSGGGSEGSFSAAFIEELRGLPGARFVIGRTRDIAADITLTAEGGVSQSVQMEPCAPGEPVLEHYKLAPPNDGAEPELVLSAKSARKLGVEPGARLTAELGRRTPEGRLEAAELTFRVSGILPETASNRYLGFLPLQVLQDIQDYRDSIEAPARGFSGRPRPEGERRFASFRLYAKDLDAVEGLAAALTERHGEARTKAREIANIRRLKTAIDRVIWILGLTVGAGFLAFTLSSVAGAVRRKEKMLGMLRLLGFPRLALLVYPMWQTFLTAVCGFCASIALYLIASVSIDRLFAEQSGGLELCRLGFVELFVVAPGVVALSFVATLFGAWKAANVEPSAVIREI